MTTKQNDSLLRMIANPYLLKKDIIPTTTHKTFSFKLQELLKEEYTDSYLSENLLNEMTDYIHERINKYQIDIYIHNFVDQCIENALSRFE